MKTFLECTDLAAREVGDTGFKNWLNFKLDAEQLEHLQRAADIYASQSNSHKPVVGGPASASVSEGEQLGNEAGGTGVSDGHTHNFKYTERTWRFKCSCGKYEDEYLREALAAARD